jgi:hypothetical protein
MAPESGMAESEKTTIDRQRLSKAPSHIIVKKTPINHSTDLEPVLFVTPPLSCGILVSEVVGSDCIGFISSGYDRKHVTSWCRNWSDRIILDSSAVVTTVNTREILVSAEEVILH